MGDPGGIGPEVIAKALQDFRESRDFYFLLIGTSVVFDFLKDQYRLDLPLHPLPTLEASFLREDSINFLDVSKETDWMLRNSSLAKGEAGAGLAEKLKGEYVFDIGKVSEVNAAMSFAALKVAAYQAATGLVDALVTAPVNKTSIRLMDPKFNGHTEYLAKIAKTKHFAMMFVGKRLKVTLATIHVPVKKVSHLITQDLVLEKIRLTNLFLRTHFNLAKPRLAVCTLNPHGKETGEEDEAEIAPAVQLACAEKIDATGPLSADQVFHDAYEGRFDAVISMYHDQGLAPFKMIHFRDGVNVTLGLPFVRTSPDHGTAFDIAYQNKADAQSMKAAIDLAKELLCPPKSSF